MQNTWFDPEAFGGLGGMKHSFSESDIRDVSLLPGVKGVMSLGSVLSVELMTTTTTRTVGQAFGRPPKEFTDPLENILDVSDSDTSLGKIIFTAPSESTSTSASLSPVSTLTSSAISSVPSTTSSESCSNGNARYYNNNASAIVVSLLKQNNVYARPLGNVVYLMPTPLTPEADRLRLIRVIKRCY